MKSERLAGTYLAVIILPNLFRQGFIYCLSVDGRNRESNGWLIDEYDRSSRRSSSSSSLANSYLSDVRTPTGNSERSESALTRPRSAVVRAVNATDHAAVATPTTADDEAAYDHDYDTNEGTAVTASPIERQIRPVRTTDTTRSYAASRNVHSESTTRPVFWDYGSKDDVEPADYDYQAVLKDEPEPSCRGLSRLRRTCRGGYGPADLGLIGVLAVVLSFVVFLLVCACKSCRFVLMFLKRRRRYAPLSTKE